MTTTCPTCYRASHPQGVPTWLTPNVWGECHVCHTQGLCYDETGLTEEGQRKEALRRASMRWYGARIHVPKEGEE